MKTLVNVALSLLLTTCLIPTLAGCSGGVVVRAPADGYYDYDYYPNSEVYYYPTGSTYYWRDHDAWHHGHDLPQTFHIEHESHVPLHLRTANPWEMHNQVRADHPAVRHEEEHH